ncbi:MAG: DMT family transporter [Bacillota bacterium]
MTSKQKIFFADGALLLCALIWGVSFALMKTTVEVVPPNYLLALRFGAGAAGLLPFVWKKLLKADARTLLSGVLLGIVTYLAFVAQTVGLTLTTAGKNAFITTVYVMLAPFFAWAFLGKRPSPGTFVAAGVCFLGIAVLSLDGIGGFNIGDALTLLCGVLFALQLSLVERFTLKGQDVTLLTMLQFAVAGAAAFAAGAFTEQFSFQMAPETIGSLAFLCLFATLIAYLL